MSSIIVCVAKQFRTFRLAQTISTRIPSAATNFPWVQRSVGLRSYCSTAPQDVEEEEQTREEEPQEEGIRETVNERLRRLSLQDPEQFKASVTPQQAEEKRWYKYQMAPFPDQRAKTSRPLRGNYRPSGSTWGIGPSHPDDYYDDDYQRPERKSFRNPDYDDGNQGYGRNYGANQRYNDRGGYGGRGGYNDRDGSSGFNPSRNRRATITEDEEDNSNDFRNRRVIDTPMRSRKFDTNADNFDDEDSYDVRSRRNGNRASRGGGDYENTYEDPVARRSKLREYDLEGDKDAYSYRRQRFSATDEVSYSNKENIDAVKKAYISKIEPIDQSGSKREMHSYASTRLSSNFDPAAKPKNLPRKEEFTAAEVGDAEVFGMLSFNRRRKDEGLSSYDMRNETMERYVEPLHEEEELEDEEENFSPERKMTMDRLVKETLKLLKGNQLTEALDFFTMSLERGGFVYRKPELQYMHRVLMSECGKAGYVKMAFKLFNRSKKRGLSVTPPMYTSLFNACANSSWYSKRNIDRIEDLREGMRRAGFIPNVYNYNCMIKAYGRNGDIQAAFAVVDEMLENNVRPRFDTFSFLLQACVSDKENGFRHAILTWDKMKQRRVRPSPFSYNLLLRCARECNVAFPSNIQKQVDQYKKRLLKSELGARSESQSMASPGDRAANPGTTSALVLRDDHYSSMKNSLKNAGWDKSEVGSSLEKLSDNELKELVLFSQPETRLRILGGTAGVLSQMRKDKVRPDLKSLQEIILCSGSVEEIQDAIRAADFLDLKPDTIFYNVIIRQLMHLKQHKAARDTFSSMIAKGVKPDIYTWGSLAWGCDTWVSADTLLSDMISSSYTPNAQIFSTLLVRAHRMCDPKYALNLIQRMPKYGVKPSVAIVDTLEHLKGLLQDGVVKFEKGEFVEWGQLRRLLNRDYDRFRSDVVEFKLHYKTWKTETAINIEPDDPWEKHHQRKWLAKQAKERKAQLEAE